MTKPMRSREEIEYELQDATVSFIKEETNPYPIPLQPVLEVLLDIRDLLRPIYTSDADGSNIRLMPGHIKDLLTPKEETKS